MVMGQRCGKKKEVLVSSKGGIVGRSFGYGERNTHREHVITTTGRGERETRKEWHEKNGKKGGKESSFPAREGCGDRLQLQLHKGKNRCKRLRKRKIYLKKKKSK